MTTNGDDDTEKCGAERSGNMRGISAPAKVTASASAPVYGTVTDANVSEARWSQLSAASRCEVLSLPAIAYVASPALARLLGISSARMRRWRSRGKGPTSEPRQGLRHDSNPQKSLYRVASVLCWLDCRPSSDAWQYERDWLVNRLLGERVGAIIIDDNLNQEDTENVARVFRGMLRFPEFQYMYRVPAAGWTLSVVRPQFALSRSTG